MGLLTFINNLKSQNPQANPRLMGSNRGDTVEKPFPEGMANYYDDSYGPLLQGMQGIGPGQGTATGLTDLLANFKGNQKHLQAFLQMAAPFLAAQMGGTKAFKDTQRWEDQTNVMQSFGTGAGMIGQGARQGQNMQAQGFARSGLGRSSALAGSAGNFAAQARSQQAGLYSQLFQQNLQNRADFSANALDSHRMLSTLALGHNPAPRVKSQGTDWGAALAGAGGNVLGAAVGGMASK